MFFKSFLLASNETRVAAKILSHFQASSGPVGSIRLTHHLQHPKHPNTHTHNFTRSGETVVLEIFGCGTDGPRLARQLPRAFGKHKPLQTARRVGRANASPPRHGFVSPYVPVHLASKLPRHQEQQEAAEKIGMAAVRYFDMKQPFT